MGVKDVITGRLLGNSERFSDRQVAETLQLLVTHGLKRGADAIHIEPHERFVLIRYRIDGALRGIHKLPRASLPALIKQLKLLADLNPEETAVPQEGHYLADIQDQTIEVRATIMPVLGGEKAVLHLAAQRKALGGLEALGFWGANLTTLHETLARPQGLITIAGTKHSGKSTTLYALLQLLNNPTHSIATIEEHATRRLPGASQTYVHPRSGATLLDALQAVLRQDPNIIMIGNLPNKATAELAVQAAVTGHLMLSEIYADSAVGSVLRLRAMGIEPFLLVSALRLSVGQRLVRRLCPQCREMYELNTDDQQELARQFGLTPGHIAKVHALEQRAQQNGMNSDKPLGSTPRAITHLWRAKNGGCNSCDRSGYQARIALTEVLPMTDLLQKHLMKHDMPTFAELHRTALKDDFIPLALDGLIKALRGETTTLEVLRSVSATNL